MAKAVSKTKVNQNKMQEIEKSCRRDTDQTSGRPRFQVTLACSREDVLDAQRLLYSVLSEEMGARLWVNSRLVV